MDETIFKQECRYLEETMSLLERKIHDGLSVNEDALNALDEQSKFLWEEVEAYYAEGEREFDRLGEMLTGLEELNRRSEKNEDLTRQLRRYRRMLLAPYFARVDFREEPGSPTYEDGATEEIYIGRASLTDGYADRVYDWRTPIASLFYRATPGHASFEAPIGTISGDMTLKRQYQIKNGKLRLYVDSDLRVADELLAEALARNATGKMHSVVETIQARQDEIIRDTDTEILLVQGAAGSGKTAVALHRVAYLLYEGHARKLSANDVLMLSPSAVFGAYVADVLPELGEENLRTLLYEELMAKNLPDTRFSSRISHFDAFTEASDEEADAYVFFGSEEMIHILDRAVDRYAHRGFGFTDILYDGNCVMSAVEQKDYLLNNPYHTPWGERLLRLAAVALERAADLQDARTRHLALLLSRDVSRANPERDARRISVADFARVKDKIDRQLLMHPEDLFIRLMRDDTFFSQMARGFDVPAGFTVLRHQYAACTEEQTLDFAAACALFYLKIRIFGAKGYEKLRQLVIDEAQDVTPLQYATLRAMMPYARVTAVGDQAQSVTGRSGGLYGALERLYAPRRTAVVTLERSYRSTAQITAFCNRLTNTPAAFFAREGDLPRVETYPDADAMTAAVARDLTALLAGGYGIAAVVCASELEARRMADRLPGTTLLTEHSADTVRGAVVLPIALAKGLEFDAVLVPNAERYAGIRGKQALYVACTRALHVLRLYAAGDSPFLDELRKPL
ncbi:MAG: AAA family ATPase [Clostridiaceae bacterium]|nr:AAA family ATPase [Clostridiaceae bacterium]